jgi:predicted MFS family arabinose efflux permease
MDDAAPLRPLTLYVMATACGLSAANIYYNQPLLEIFQRYFHASEAAAGQVATAAAVGYGVGIFLFIPLGDLVERRRLVLSLITACIGFLIVATIAPRLSVLVGAQFLIGVTAMSAQLLIPLSVDLTPIERRGRTVGIMMGGLLCGILMARVLAGLIGAAFGWRAMYGTAAALMLILLFVLMATLPHRRPTLKIRYPALMASMVHLMRDHPPLNTASIISGITFACFTAFWTTLVFLLNASFHRGAAAAGLFGLVGIVGALGAPIAGKLSDKRGPNFTVNASLILVAASFVLMATWVSLISLVLGIVLLDLGVQSIQVAKQAKVMALVPEARNRINTIYMVWRFVGGAAGSALGSVAWVGFGWTGVCGLGLGLISVAGIVQWIGTGVDRRYHAANPHHIVARGAVEETFISE